MLRMMMANGPAFRQINTKMMTRLFQTANPQTRGIIRIPKLQSLKPRRLCDKAGAKAETPAEVPKVTWWNSATWWGAAGAIAGWGMTGAAIWDATNNGPDKISLGMTGVLIVYSSLFARWAFVVSPQNMLLASCHMSNVVAQCNQMRRAVNHKLELGKSDEVNDMGMKIGAGGVAIAALIAGGPTLQGVIVGLELGPISSFAGAAAGPFTTHFWAPMSKWMISGQSFFEYDRPIEKISLAQYSALTLTGFFFSRYALLVTPINYMLCSVNIALFGSSAFHLIRKVNGDYVGIGYDKK